MVKEIDDLRPDHIGWRLWQAAALWKGRFARRMIDAGHDWYGEARSSVIPHIAIEGSRQVDIVRQMGLSKQAVQQLIADLEAAGIVRREPDPDDRRGKIVRFTEAGLAAQKDAVAVKRKVEAEFRQQLGTKDFDRLHELLVRLGGPAAADD